MGLMKSLKEKIKEQEDRGRAAGDGDRLKNKVKGDKNVFGDRQAENEGANQQNSGEGGAHRTGRGAARRDKFKKQNRGGS